MAELAEQADELTPYERERFHAARAAGLTRLEAARFAKGTTPLRHLRLCRDGKCPAATIARIVC